VIKYVITGEGMSAGIDRTKTAKNSLISNFSEDLCVELISIIEDLMVVQNSSDLSEVIGRDIRKIIPHEIAIFALGDMRLKSGDYALNMGYPSGFLQEIISTQSGRQMIISPVVDAAINSDIGVIEVSDTLSFDPDYEQWTEAAMKYQIHDMVASAKIHSDSNLCSYLCFTNQNKYRDQKHHKLIKILEPFLDSALVRVAHSDKSYDPFNITNRERTILRFLVNGDSNKEISALLHISQQTVKHHVSHIMSKLRAKNRMHVADIAKSAGLADL